MTNDPASLRDCVGTQNCNASRVRGSARSGATGGLFIQSPAFGREAPSRGRVAITRAAFAVTVISPSYPVVFAPFRVCP